MYNSIKSNNIVKQCIKKNKNYIQYDNLLYFLNRFLAQNYSWFILLLGVITALYYCKIEYWITLLIILLSKIIYDVDIFTNIEYKNGNLQECKMYTSKLSDSQIVEKEISSLKEYINSLSLSPRVYKVFSLYINQGNSPSTTTLKNVSVGIMKYKKSGFVEVDIPTTIQERERELEEYLFNHQYTLIELPKTRSVWVNFKLRSDFSLIYAMKKFYSSLKTKLNTLIEVQSNMERFNKFIILEIHTDDEINFHLPVENLEYFNIN